MSGFSASEAALEGFRLTRERPGTIAVWSGLYAVVMAMIGMLTLASLDPHLVDLARKGKLSPTDMDAVTTMLAKSGPAFFVVLLMVLALTSVLTAGIFRLVLRPEQPGFAHLRIGVDELKLTIANFMLFSIGMACLFVGFAVVAIAEQAAPALAFAVGLAVAGFTAWAGVRLALATPMTFATHRIAIGEAWGLTRGKFWPLFGMISLSVVFYIVVFALFSIVGAAIVAAAGGQEAIADNSHLTVFGWVAVMVTLLLNFVLQVLQIVMIYAPFAVAYQQLHGDAPANPLRMRPEPG